MLYSLSARNSKAHVVKTTVNVEYMYHIATSNYITASHYYQYSQIIKLLFFHKNHSLCQLF